MVCIDSDVLINFLRNREDAKEIIKGLIEQEIELSTTTINTFELYKGLKKIKDNPSSLIIALANFKILNFDINASKRAAEITNYLESKGEIIDIADIMIASVVITNNETLLTNNLNHFKRIPELKIKE
jgi:tRNA(fMet)-specific endonuclease VapC